MQLEQDPASQASGAAGSFAEPAPAWRSYDIFHGAAGTRTLILCDHAVNLLPPEYGTLGLDQEQLNRHIAYDIGALGVAREMGRQLEATVIASGFSRLLIDPNRGDDDPTLVMRLSDGAAVPGNRTITDAEIAKRIVSYYRPYHEAIRAGLDAMTALGLVPLIVSIHSFTPVWRGCSRKWHAGILWDKDPRLAMPLLDALRTRTGLEIGDNEPYSGRLHGDSLYRHGTLRGLPHALIEVRQDLISEEGGQRAWGKILAECMQEVLASPVSASPLCRVDYFGSCTDIGPVKEHSLLGRDPI
jgi:predicted N-formylglutamate amidohydrolase